MIDFGRWKNSRAAIATGAAALVAVGAAGGAGAVQATRPAVEMAPTVATPIARLGSKSGVVTVKGRVAEIYGDRFVVQDGSGRAMVAAGNEARGSIEVGQQVMAQGRFDDGQLRASYLVGRNGEVAAVGPQGPGRGRPGPRRGPGRDGPPPPCPPGSFGPSAPGAPPPPPIDGPAAGATSAAPPATGIPPEPHTPPQPGPGEPRR